jgi:hypothetical protein
MTRFGLLRILRIAGFALAFSSLASTEFGQTTRSGLDIRPNRASGDGIEVNAVRVIQLGSTEVGASYRYLISFNYRFDGRATVFLPDGPGLVPSEGQFSYLTTSLQLTFLDSSEGKPLVVVPLQVTFVPTGSAEITVPNEDEFPRFALDGLWKGRSSDFVLHLDRTLSSLGIEHEYCRKSRQCIVTRYVSLDFSARHNEKGRVAIELTYAEEQGKTHFRIFHLTNEKLSHDDWSETQDRIDDYVERAAEKLIKNLALQLEVD